MLLGSELCPPSLLHTGGRRYGARRSASERGKSHFRSEAGGRAETVEKASGSDYYNNITGAPLAFSTFFARPAASLRKWDPPAASHRGPTVRSPAYRARQRGPPVLAAMASYAQGVRIPARCAQRARMSARWLRSPAYRAQRGPLLLRGISGAG